MFKVTNGNEFEFTAGFDGKHYRFPPGTPVVCPDAATIHIFGLTEPNKALIVSRHGWAKPTDPLHVGLDVLKKFQFLQLKPEYEAPLALVDHGPAPVVVRGGDSVTDGSDSPPTQPRRDVLAEAAAQRRIKSAAVA